MGLTSSFLSSSFFMSVLCLGVVGCADVGTSASTDTSYAEDDARADGVIVPLRNRATWKARLVACRTAFDAALNAPGDELGDSVVPFYEQYADCLSRANDRTLARIGRLLASNDAAGEGALTLDDAIRSFASSRTASDTYCGYATGSAAQTVFVNDTGLFATFESAKCRLENEIELARLIGTHVVFEDADDQAFAVDFLRDADETGLASASAPLCTAAYQAAIEADDSQQSYTIASYDELACVENGTAAAIASAVSGDIAPQLFGAELDAYVATTQRAFSEVVTEAALRCRILADAGYNAGGSLARTEAAACAAQQARRYAGYIDRYAPIAADPEADPDSNGIPGDQTESSGAAGE